MVEHGAGRTIGPVEEPGRFPERKSARQLHQPLFLDFCPALVRIAIGYPQLSNKPHASGSWMPGDVGKFGDQLAKLCRPPVTGCLRSCGANVFTDQLTSFPGPTKDAPGLRRSAACGPWVYKGICQGLDHRILAKVLPAHDTLLLTYGIKAGKCPSINLVFFCRSCGYVECDGSRSMYPSTFKTRQTISKGDTLLTWRTDCPWRTERRRR